MLLQVAVIGAGAAGLVALRHLSAEPDKFQACGFEQTAHVGGTWVYTDAIGLDQNGIDVHSSMYKNLRTNLPKEVMAFPDFAFPDDLPSFVRHQDVRQYLESYTDKFNIRKLIKFNSKVEQVTPAPSETGTKWNVTYKDIHKEAGTTTYLFDAVMVCNGHYSTPLKPDIVGLGSFPGSILHSHDYRESSGFAGLRVVCLGAGASGQDIAVDLASVCKQVILSHGKPKLKSKLPSNVNQAPGIKEVRNNVIIFVDGSEVEVDAIILCTGYHYKFPFLSEDCKLKITEERLTPLYKHVIHTEFPTLSLLGITKLVLPFPQFHCQVKFVLAALDGSMKLPSKEEMNKDTEDDYEWRLSQGMPHRYAHLMAHLQWKYNDDLAEAANFEPIPDVVRKLYDHVHEQRKVEFMTFRCKDYEFTDADIYKSTPSKAEVYA